MGLLGTKWLLRAIKTIPHDERKRDYDSEQSHFFDRSACQRSSLADLYSRYGRKHNSSESPQRRACAWSVRRRLLLDRSHSAIAVRWPQRHLCQNPLTTLVATSSLVSRGRWTNPTRQYGPTVLAGHSFSGMIVTDAGVHPNVSAAEFNILRIAQVAPRRLHSDPQRKARR